MPRIIIDGEAMDIPADEATGSELKTLARVAPERVLYMPGPGGRAPKVIDADERVKLADGTAVNTLRPFITGAGESR